jgi:hypothetical protein
MTAAEVRLRIAVADAWDTVTVTAAPSQSMAELKQLALNAAMGRAVAPDQYVMKYRGALVLDEHATVAGLALRSGAPLIVLPARRHPVR